MNKQKQEMSAPAKKSAGFAALRLSGYFILSAVALIGIWAIALRFREGLIITNMTQHVPWGFWISLYIYFIGLSAGSFLISTLIYVFGVKRFEPAGPIALLQALICLFLGMFLIWVDLGHPQRFFIVFLYWNPTSVLAWEVLFYVGYTIIIILELFLILRPVLAKRAQAGGPLAGFYGLLALGRQVPSAAWKAKAVRWVKFLGIVGIPIAIGVHGGTGAIFAVVKSRPVWYTGLFPIVFLVSALVSGGALLTFLSATTSRVSREKKLDLVRGLARLTVGILAIDLLLIASEILITFYGGIPTHVAGWRATLFGPLGWVFWCVQIGLGALIPILIVAGRRTGQSLGWLALAGLLIVIGVIGVRFNIVIPAQLDPEFPTLPEAYHQLRFARGYFPSLNEWLVGIGTIALGIWGYILTKWILPLEREECLNTPESFSEKGGQS